MVLLCQHWQVPAEWRCTARSGTPEIDASRGLLAISRRDAAPIVVTHSLERRLVVGVLHIRSKPREKLTVSVYFLFECFSA